MFNRCATSGLSYVETKNIMRNNQNVVLIDVRSRQEFNEGHLPNAINISVYDIAKEIVNKVTDKNCKSLQGLRYGDHEGDRAEEY